MAERVLRINAAGINSGGGLVLLVSLINSLQHKPIKIWLDERVEEKFSLLDESLVIVKVNIVDRVLSSFVSAWEGKRGDILFCFNNLPPMIRSKSYTVTYIHSPQFVGLDKGVRYTFREFLRFKFERLWFRLFHRFSDEIWVQTPTMRELLLTYIRGVPVKVMPFWEEGVGHETDRSANLDRSPGGSGGLHSFFYPASFAGHKNHHILVKAFEALEQSRPSVRLILTLPEADFDRLTRGRTMKNIVNLGVLDHERVLEVMANSSALIFPSVAETFGIPLLEAAALNVPIIASERDFVRDVCNPVEAFDPFSARSIASAVCRFLDVHPNETKQQIMSTAEFVNSLQRCGSM